MLGEGRIMRVMVTGGAGYIGSHAVMRLLVDGHDVVVIDNLFRGHAAAIDRLRAMPGVTPGRLVFQVGDIGDRGLVELLLRDHRVEVIMHFAALAYVRESVHMPLAYYRNNTAGALSLLEAADACGVDRFIFSSTCATYGEASPGQMPITEENEQRPINPYGWSKLHVERMLKDLADERGRAGRPLGFAALRYFNVAGSDRTGLIGEHHEPETHIIPLLLQTALGVRESFTILGTDYPTPDGTCVRDYIHVEDLVDAHVLVMNRLKAGEQRAYNLGNGRPFSVREIIASVERVTGRRLAIKEGARALGDPPVLYADAGKIARELGWRARVTELDEIVRSAWAWYERHPRGYM